MSIITTFDGKQWDKKKLLDKMLDDEFYYGYLGKKALSSSACKDILKSPKGFFFNQKYGDTNSNSPALVAGRIFHTLLLEPEKEDLLTIVDVKSRNTIKFKEASKGKNNQIVYTKSEYDTAMRLITQVRKNKAAQEILSDSLYEAPEAGMIDGIPFRGKADVLKFDTIVDVKTTTDINGFKWSADKYGYDLQAYLYCKLFNIDQFTFLVVDKKSCDVGVFTTSDQFLDRGRQKLHKAINTYKNYFINGSVEDVMQYTIEGVL